MAHILPSLNSAGQPADISKHPALQAFYRNLAPHWARISVAPSPSPCANQAIALLAGGSAPPDEKDWAERYLCGMTAEPLAAFLRGRLAQS